MSKSFISEDDIEKSILKKIKDENLGYNILELDSSLEKRDDLNDGTDRTNKSQCVLPTILLESLKRLNPKIDEKYIRETYDELIKDYTDTDINQTNYNLYKIIRDGKKITFTNEKGVEDFLFVKIIDFDNPENNDFTAVTQMWIKGRYNYRRPDILIFINGMPLVFIELKKSTRKVEEGYSDNLTNYKKDIPNLFSLNQICVLSNGLETRIGAFNSSYDFFFEWLKNSEEEKVDREKIYEDGTSVYFFVKGLLNKENLIDYIENFIMYDNGKNLTKVIAKNHQYIGVNNLIKSFHNKKELNGKLGVFWHTQGSGKSYSMVFFVRKVNRKIKGNFSFLIITDRDDLNTQIKKTFIRCEVLGSKDEVEPATSNLLRDYLKSNKPFVFTLIHKFRIDKKNNEKKYPILSERDDIIVLVDEAHRTEYANLAENMRTALPNASFVAFTGTPLLGTKKLTNQWFGDYVSIYDFKQSVDDGSTVPLYYSRRVPEVGLTNNFLDDDILNVIENNNLNEKEASLVEDANSNLAGVIKREERLKKIAKDIAYHFPRRGFLGKGMVVCIDKYTVVKMYDLVEKYFEEEKINIIKDRNNAKTNEEKEVYDKILNYINHIKMAVVISDDGDDEKFEKKGLDIKKHRDEMARVDENGYDIEDRFKDPANPLSLVFVCAMWLTGFDVKNLSTLYLDKPMKSHTLMQAIARANRVYPGKECGLIVDYINVFSYMKKALGDYAIGDGAGEMPVKNIDKLVGLLDVSIDEADKLLKEQGFKLDDIIKNEDTEYRLEKLREIYNVLLLNKEASMKFKVITNAMNNIYDASKPEIFNMFWENDKFKPLVYLNGLFTNSIDDAKVEKAKKDLASVLDYSVSAKESETIDTTLPMLNEKIIDLSKINFDDLKKEFKETKYKGIQIEDLKEFIEDTLKQLINRNKTRRKFSERYQEIIDRYNSGSNDAEEFFNELLKLMEELKKEQERHYQEDLTEEELEIYDLLLLDDKKLTKDDTIKVKLAAKNLYKKLSENRDTLLVVDWFKDEKTKIVLKSAVSESLNNDLPTIYDKELFQIKTNLLMEAFIDKAVQGLKVA